MADKQRLSVYSAEFALRAMLDNSHDIPTVEVYGSTFTLPIERKFASIESIQEYVNKVLSLNWVRKEFSNAAYGVRVRERRGQTAAHYCLGEIAIPPHVKGKAWAMREIVVLHEISHHLAPADSHGAQFCKAFTFLLDGIMGPEIGFIMSCLLRDEGCEIG